MLRVRVKTSPTRFRVKVRAAGPVFIEVWVCSNFMPMNGKATCVCNLNFYLFHVDTLYFSHVICKLSCSTTFTREDEGRTKVPRSTWDTLHDGDRRWVYITDKLTFLKYSWTLKHFHVNHRGPEQNQRFWRRYRISHLYVHPPPREGQLVGYVVLCFNFRVCRQEMAQ